MFTSFNYGQILSRRCEKFWFSWVSWDFSISKILQQQTSFKAHVANILARWKKPPNNLQASIDYFIIFVFLKLQEQQV